MYLKQGLRSYLNYSTAYLTEGMFQTIRNEDEVIIPPMKCPNLLASTDACWCIELYLLSTYIHTAHFTSPVRQAKPTA
jgi:hypothetical protein